MSRIHEALKKAEEERAGQQSTLGVAQPQETPPVSAVKVTAPSTPASQELDIAPLTLSLLSAHSARPAWNPDPERALFLDPDVHSAPGAEEFRSLRSRLYRIREKQSLKTLLIGSAVSGEGKSFVASNLAQMMARQRGRRNQQQSE